MTRKFSLRWIDFHTNLYQSLEAFLETQDLVDVTLAAGGKYFSAHKLVLSICSPFFKELFKTNTCEHPIVILKDVQHLELHKLLQFIYCGEVHVTQQELNPFLETAEFLQIKGLASVREPNEPATTESDEKEETNVPDPPLDQHSECNPRNEDNTDVSATETSIECVSEHIKKEFDDIPDSGSCSFDKKALTNCNSSMQKENIVDMKELEPMVHKNICNSSPDIAKSTESNKTTNIKCKQCYRVFANRYNLKVHIKDKHDSEEGTLQCHKCRKRMRNQSCLRVHIYQHHKQFSFTT